MLMAFKLKVNLFEIFGSIEIRRPNGDLHSIIIEDLSVEDLNYVRTLIPPEVEILVRASESAKERNEEFIWANDKVTVVSANVEVRKKVAHLIKEH